MSYNFRYDVKYHIDNDNDNTDSYFTWLANSPSGWITMMQLRENQGAGDAGSLYVNGNVTANAWDLAENYNYSGIKPESGDVVCIDSENNEKLILCSMSYDKNVAGIVSTKPGFLLSGNIILGEPEYISEMKGTELDNYRKNMTDVFNNENIPLALAGRVPCKVDASYGKIKRGDLLTSSNTSGYAMKAEIDSFEKIGSVIGKALEPIDSGKALSANMDETLAPLEITVA